MRKQEITLYSFPELNEKAQQKALNHLREWNTETDWWIPTYEDANMIGLEIDSFDLARQTICCKFMGHAKVTADLILANHGETCDTYKLAKAHITAGEKLEDEALNADIDPALDDITDDFRLALQRGYLTALQEKYNHLTDDATLIEQMEEGEYEYHSDGRLYTGEN